MYGVQTLFCLSTFLSLHTVHTRMSNVDVPGAYLHLQFYINNNNTTNNNNNNYYYYFNNLY